MADVPPSNGAAPIAGEQRAQGSPPSGATEGGSSGAQYLGPSCSSLHVAGQTLTVIQQARRDLVPPRDNRHPASFGLHLSQQRRLLLGRPLPPPLNPRNDLCAGALAGHSSFGRNMPAARAMRSPRLQYPARCRPARARHAGHARPSAGGQVHRSGLLLELQKEAPRRPISRPRLPFATRGRADAPANQALRYRLRSACRVQFGKQCLQVNFTVCTEIANRRAIDLLLRPSPIRARISRSLGDQQGRRPDRREAARLRHPGRAPPGQPPPPAVPVELRRRRVGRGHPGRRAGDRRAGGQRHHGRLALRGRPRPMSHSSTSGVSSVTV